MKRISSFFKRYFIDAMGAMALGLFASLLIGTIFKTIGQYTNFSFLVDVSGFCTKASGMAIGVAIAYALKADPLVMYCCAVVGSAGYDLGATIPLANGENISYTAGPAGAFVAVVIAVEIGMLISKKTKIDIILTPALTILTGCGVAYFACKPIAWAMYYLGDFINVATEMHPFAMGIVISVVVGIILTLPISSAAICAMIGITGLAGGAATVGCCAQMVGFAVISFRENKFGGLVAQGLGTSMLQMGNICRHPQIWIPPTLAAAICGPISTCIFHLNCKGVSAGMGTCGLVGPIGVISETEHSPMMWIGLFLCCIILPAIISLAISEFMRRMNWIKYGDMKLQLQ